MSSTEFPVNVTIPFTGSTGSGHSATQKKYANNLLWIQELISLRALLCNYKHQFLSTQQYNRKGMQSHNPFMHYLRLHTGGTGENVAELAFTCVHVTVVLPTSSNPMLQL